jgi:hypothetical protein
VSPSEEQILHDNRPVLIELSNRLQLQPRKLLHIEFETNPLKTNADYRIQAKSQSIEIIYHAVLCTRQSFNMNSIYLIR